MIVEFPKLLCTSSKKKESEWNAIFAELVGQGAPQVSAVKPRSEPVEIQGRDTVTVAVTKAITAYLFCDRKPVLVEDIGFGIDELKGWPGALYKWDEEGLGLSGLLEVAKQTQKRLATVTSTIAFAHPQTLSVHVVKVQVHGWIPWYQNGTNGWGFDPIFIPDDQPEGAEGLTYALMTDAQKNLCSMRRQCIEKLLRGEWDPHPMQGSPLFPYV